MKEFFTRTRAEEGVNIPLFTPEGELTPHWIKIRGVDSDAFRIAELQAGRSRVEAANLPTQAARDKAALEIRTKLLASLVIGWSFGEECTEQAVVNFLTEAPQIADAINAKAGQRTSFFRQGPNSSASGIEQG